MVPSNIRVMLADDQPLMRVGLSRLLEEDARIHVVAQSSGLDDAVQQVAQAKPDVVMMEVSFRGASGIDLCRALRDAYPGSRAVMFTAEADAEAVLGAIQAGAAGYLLKGAEPARIVEAVVRVAGGACVLDPQITDTVFRYIREGSVAAKEHALDVLGSQEQRILALLAQGRTNRQIAVTLSLSPHTVKSYVSSLLQKLRFTRRSQAAAWLSRVRPAIVGYSGQPGRA